MHFFDFQKRMSYYPVFTSNEARNVFFDERNILVQIAFWTKKGYIKKIKKGLYVLTGAEKEINPLALSAKIYEPSYLSLEFALNYYGVIPDIPGTYTSVTSRKTMAYTNQFGNFSYQKVKRNLFFGYLSFSEKNLSFNLATPEKALMDYLYLNKNKLIAGDDFWREMRIDENFKFSRKKIELYKKLFQDEKVNQLVDSILSYQKNAR